MRSSSSRPAIAAARTPWAAWPRRFPIKDDPEANENALDKVRADKLREVREGHDGTWVAHPALVAVAKQVFDAGMPGPNQLTRMRDDVTALRGSHGRAAAGHSHRKRVFASTFASRSGTSKPG